VKLPKLLISSIVFITPISFAAPDEGVLGKGQNYPTGSVRNWTQPQYRVGSWSAPQKIEGLPHQIIEKSPKPLPLAAPSSPPTIRYTHDGRELTLEQYLDRQRVTGLAVVKDGKLIYEKYQYGRGPEARFFSYSIAKSVTGLLIGIAIDKGLVRSLDDTAEMYSPTLRGTPFGTVRIRDLLRMASGIEFSETYTGNDDASQLSRAAFTDSPPLTSLFKAFSKRTESGSKFNYSSLETLALGYLLKDVTGKSVSEITKEWVWDPIGAEDEAYWILSKSGMEGVYCCLAASMRDWAKLGLLYAQKGSLNGQQIVSASFITEGTSINQVPGQLRSGVSEPFAGYGYHVWLLPGPGNQYVMRGIHGQAIYVHTDLGLVMVHTAVFDKPSARMDPGPYDEQLSLWRGLVQSLSR
jgi:CubicO group peptidase (beta-lactamase class C family)